MVKGCGAASGKGVVTAMAVCVAAAAFKQLLL